MGDDNTQSDEHARRRYCEMVGIHPKTLKRWEDEEIVAPKLVPQPSARGMISLFTRASGEPGPGQSPRRARAAKYPRGTN
jgi:hypothetical protein